MKLTKTLAVIAADLLVPACFTSAQTEPPIVYSDSQNVMVVTLHDGDSIIPKLAEVVNNHGIRSGLILAAIGKIRNFTLGYYEITLREFYKRTYPGPYDLTVTQGIIAHATDGSLNMDIVLKCDSTNTDLHASDVIYSSVGGHLFGGIVSNMSVFVIKRLDTLKLIRDYHPENGSWDLDMTLEPPGVINTAKGANVGVIEPQDYAISAHERTDLFWANFDAPVFDVAGRRISRVRNGQLENVGSGMYVMPQRAGKTATIIHK